MKNCVPFLFWLCGIVASAQNLQITPPLENLLIKLDEIVAEKANYHEQREKQAAKLKGQLHGAQTQLRIGLYKEIFDIYSHFQTDSANVYLDCLEQLSATGQDEQLSAYVKIARAELHAITGLYADAEQALGEVDPKQITAANQPLRLYYFRVRRTLSGWMSQYIQFPNIKKMWMSKVEQYRDSLIAIDPNPVTCDVVKADKANAEGNPEKALNLLLPYANNMDEAHTDPYVSYTLAESYHALGQTDKVAFWLAQTAICDLTKGTTEYQALPWLAQMLFEAGQVERAYQYMICSMEDANFCNAYLRTVEVSNVFPIIDKQYKQTTQEQRRRQRNLLYLLGVLLVILVGIIVVFYLQMKKLRLMRRRQAHTNASLEEANSRMQQAMDQLHETNETLQKTYAALRLTDKMKEEYIARYLSQCRAYLDKMEESRKRALRMVKDHQIDELYKLLKIGQQIKDEQEHFYADFDAAFLTLFPHFIDQFNALLMPEGRICPKHDNQLNTELRIFALIRLGVKDTGQIAHFLNFSMATVYNYRSKIRNKAVGNPAEFEQKVCEL